MSGSISQVEALLDNLEQRFRNDIRSSDELEEKELPEPVECSLKEAGKAFDNVKNNVYPGATENELDQAEKESELLIQKYEEAIDSHIDYFGAENLIGPNIVINQTLDGELSRDLLFEAADVNSRRIRDLESPSDQGKVRRNLDDDSAREMVEKSDYNLESIVKQDYLDELYDSQESLEAAIEGRRGSDGW